jgi:hypothetical protein
MSSKRKKSANAGGKRGKGERPAVPADHPPPAENVPQPEAAEAPSGGAAANIDELSVAGSLMAEGIPDHPPTAVPSEKDLVYATLWDTLEFLTLKMEVDFGSTYFALEHAGTWGEFRRHVTPQRWWRVLQDFRAEGAIDFPTWYANLVANSPKISRRRALRLYLKKKVGERLPTDADSPVLESLPSRTMELGAWLPEFDMINWVPQSIQQKFGTIESAQDGTPRLRFDPAREEEIVLAFESLGYTCLKAPWLVCAAVGQDLRTAIAEPPDPS